MDKEKWMTLIDKNVGIAVFGGGCFWCTEAVFGELDGVRSVISGYSGGDTDQPSYYDVCTETTGHAEVVKIEFEPHIISYSKLLEVFFKIHDPTTLNQQGADKGTRYRSIILYTNDSQREKAENYIEKLKASGIEIVTDVVAFSKFYEAEEEHKDFYKKNPDMMYCQIVIQPKMNKLQHEFSTLLADRSIT